jgi:putative redox protein
MDRPEAKGGENRGAMGGEHLLMSLGGCFMSNLLAAIQSREAEVANVDLAISGTLESAPPHFSAIEMNVSADHSDSKQMQKLITVAERGCIVANTLKNSVKLSINLA